MNAPLTPEAPFGTRDGECQVRLGRDTLAGAARQRRTPARFLSGAPSLFGRIVGIMRAVQGDEKLHRVGGK